jgi:DNA polymerase-3 subunit gamma/tau
MRDSLSILDQAIAHGAGRVSTAGVSAMLGAIDQAYLLDLLDAVAGVDAAAVLGIADDMQARSLSFDAALADLARLLLSLAVAQAVPRSTDEQPEAARLASLAERLDGESIQLYYEIALHGREELELAPDEHAGFVMTLLRMLAFRPEGAGKTLPAPKAGEAKAGPRPQAAPARAPASSAAAPTAAGPWPELVRELPVVGAARELARNAELQRREGNTFELVVPKGKAYLAERAYVDKLKAALEQHLGAAVLVKVTAGEVSGATAAAIDASERQARRAAAEQSVQSDGFVKDLVNLFDGKVVDSSIRDSIPGESK